jgi:ribosomal protein L13
MLIDYIKARTIGITLKEKNKKFSRYRFSRSTSFIDNNDIKVESVDPEHYVHSAVNKMIFQTNTTRRYRYNYLI